jgi:ABC-type glycerol-3-phosphate transport system permease component
MVLVKREVHVGKKRVLLYLTPSWVVVYILMLGLVGFTALPIVYVISTALKPIDELFLFPPRFLVRRPTFSNFADLLTSLSSSAVPFARYAFHSVFVSAVIVLFTVLVSAMGAFSLVKFKPPGSKAIFAVVIAALMFSPHVTTIPRYFVVNALGLINTYWALILPSIAVSYNFFLMKQFCEQIPDALLESARMDGAKELRVFWSIIMPSIKPAWATLVVLSFVSTWNDYFSPLVFTTSQAMRTMPLALQTIAGGVASASIGRAGAIGAATLIMILPTIILFTFMQRLVMQTMTHSGIKG